MTTDNPHPETPLSSTDSPETYSTGSGAAVEPDELDKKRILAQFLRIARNHKTDLEMLPTFADLEAYIAKQVDAAVAAELESLLAPTNAIIYSGKEGGLDSEYLYKKIDKRLEQLKKKE